MPLTQEKPRYEISFTNNNDHNYLHKKFKKMASTNPRADEQSSESDSSQNKDMLKLPTSMHSSISNHSIAAAHPEIEKIKLRGAESNRIPENNVQTNFNDRNDFFDLNVYKGTVVGENSFEEENINKTENIITAENSREINTGGRHICPYCRLSFAKPSVLRKHIRAHTNERPYPCATCGIAFKTKSNLYKHCKSRSHAVRSQGGENAPPINEEDWSLESESDASLPPPSISESATESVSFRREENSRMSESFTTEIVKDSVCFAPSSFPPNNDFSHAKTIYKPKFHSRSSLTNDDEYKHKKVLAPNPNFINEHISKIISDNEAIVDVLETPLQRKYGKIKQIAESKHSFVEDNLNNVVTKNESGPLNLSKNGSDGITHRKRYHSASFVEPDHYSHFLNPEGSIIKDLLLKTKNCTTSLLPVTGGSYESTIETIESQRNQFPKGDDVFMVAEQSLSPREVVKNIGRENLYVRSNSINVTLYESRCHSPRARTLRSPLNNTPGKPENLVIIKPESSDIIAPLPSPGPLLGNTRLVDSRVDNIRQKTISGAKRRLDSRNDVFCGRSSEELMLQRMELYPQNKKRCFESKATTLHSLEELSHSPMRQNSTSLQMFGGEVKIINNSGSTTTLRIEPTRQLSPIMISQATSPSKLMEGEASNIVRSGLHSGGSIMHNPPTPKDNLISPRPQTPRIMLSIAASIPTPNLTVTTLPTPNITHFQFPPLGAITAFNPLTLPPLSPALSPNGATTILHGGKLIPHVPGIPGPNTQTSFGPNSSLLLKYPQNGEFSRSHSASPKEEMQLNRLHNHQRKLQQVHETPANNINFKKSNAPRNVNKDSVVHMSNASASNEKLVQSQLPRFKIRYGDKTVAKTVQLKVDDKYSEVSVKTVPDQAKPKMLKSPKQFEKIGGIISTQTSVIKMSEHSEFRNFNFENFITKAEIYNNVAQHNPKTVVQHSVQEPLSISVQTTERSETLYFQKNTNSKITKDERKSRFLRPSSLPLKPGTFTPKKHHGITPNANTMPLISPETPRPAKAYGQLYLNGNAYTYLGLKCSTKVFYCTLNRPQPTYVPNQVSLSMYCNWQILLEQTPNPLGLSTLALMALYDSRHRPQNITIAAVKHEQIVTHSSQWNNDFPDNKQKSISTDAPKKHEELKSSADTLSTKSKELAGGFESNEEYTYVRGRGRGRYVCLECGIRCKKPSMLKKHIRTHTDVRPYTCKHCSFSFKTKGNLTKHMKSKAHYKKCSELGIHPNEGADIDSSEMNQGSGETDDESESDLDDGNEGETESSDTDSYKSRLPEHEAAHCLLSLSGSRPSSVPAPGLLTSARPCTYPYTPTGKEEFPVTTSSRDEISINTPESNIESDEPMDLSRGDSVKSSATSEIHAARESSVMASLASNTAKLPLQAQWTNGEPMLHAYLTERALQDTKIKQSQFINSLSKHVRKQELSKIVQHESSNLVLNNYETSKSASNSMSTQNSDGFSVALTYSKSSIAETSVSHSLNTTRVSSCEPPKTPTPNPVSSPVPVADSSKTAVTTNEVNTSTENAKFVASEYLKMARGKAESSNSVEKREKQENTFNQINDENDRRDSREHNDTEMKNVPNMHTEAFPVARKVVIGVGGLAFKVDSKNKDYPNTGVYTPGRLTEDGRSVCVVCNKSFSKPSQLRLHINIHYMERPYRCSACAVSFRTRGHLQKHERSGSHHNKVSMTSTFGAATSSNPRPFRCSDCNIAFRIHGHLAKHLRSKMHVMRLECLSKLPFGTFAEIERAGVSLTDIDTTDCANSLASLQLLAQKLHEKDPTKLESWDPTMVPPLLPAGRESSDDEDGALQVDTKQSEYSERDSEQRTSDDPEGPLSDSVRVV